MWELTILSNGQELAITCNFLFLCGGYYSYDKPYMPNFPNQDKFKGKIIHPQFWDEAMDYTNKKVVVIGSGATAVTLVPAIAEKAGHVTMLQRSPSYVVSAPSEDSWNKALNKILPTRLTYFLIRWKNVLRTSLGFYLSRKYPARVKERLINMVREELGDDFDVEKHFTPRYNPWDQRMCLIPNGDLYQAINNGSAQVITGDIETWTESGLTMTDGTEIDADIIVTATGLKLIVMSGVEFEVDGKAVHFPETFTYKGMMYSSIPNMAQTFGYINASWTLRADLTAEYVCRLLNHMDAVGASVVTPTLRPEDHNMPARDWIEDFTPGYMQRMMHLFPKQGYGPWCNTQNYRLDKRMIRKAPIEDDALVFSNPEAAKAA